MRFYKPAVAAILAALLGSALLPSKPAAAAGSLSYRWSTTVSEGPGSHGPSDVTNEPFAGATVGDLFGDGRKEVVAGFNDGSVWAFDATSGRVLPGWPKYTGGNLHTNPTIADLYGNGRGEVIASSEAGWIFVWNGDGSTVPGWPQHTQPPASNVRPGLFGGIAVGDLFGNGQRELVAASWDQHLWAWYSNGAVVPGFPIHMWDTAFDTPALADLEHHGQLDIVVGVDSTGPPYDPYPRGGEYWAFRPSGCIANRYANAEPCALPGWPKTFNETPWSSPAAVDLLHTGTPQIIAGTGFEIAPPAGEYINGWTATGRSFGHWPVGVPGRTMASVAVGDLFGNGSRDVVAANENGWLYAWDGNGNLLPGWPVHPNNSPRLVSTPTIGPVGSGSQNGVWIASGADLIAYNHLGQVVSQTTGLEWGSDSAPAIADLGDGQLSAVTVDQSNQAATAWTVRAYPIPGTSRMLPGAWPNFHGNAELSGTLAPTATMDALPASESTTGFNISWTLDSLSPPATQYKVWVRDHATSSWMVYSRTGDTSVEFFGQPGHTYSFAVEPDARGASQDMSFVNGISTTTVSGTATRSTPFKAMYGVQGYGNLDPGSSTPMLTGSYWENWDIVRGIVLNSTGQGGYILDGWGGVHNFGNAPAVRATGWWQGWDIARGIALRADGQSGYVLDGWGGLHPFGVAGDMPPQVRNTGYFPGWDIARDVELRPDGVSGYVLDGWGGLHTFGSTGHMAPFVWGNGYWRNWDIARRFVIDSTGNGGYVLDGWGGLHPFGTNSSTTPPNNPPLTGYWSGWDIARGVDYLPGSSTQGYTVDAWGGFHPFGNAPSVVSAGFMPGGVVRDLAIS